MKAKDLLLTVSFISTDLWIVLWKKSENVVICTFISIITIPLASREPPGRYTVTYCSEWYKMMVLYPEHEHQYSVHWPGCIKFPKLSDTEIAPHSPFNLTHLFLVYCYMILLSVGYRLEFYLLWSCNCSLQFRNTTWTEKHKQNWICVFQSMERAR